MVDLGEGKNSTSNTKSIQIKAILEQYQQTKQNNFKFLVKMLSLILTEFGKGMKILFIVTFTQDSFSKNTKKGNRQTIPTAPVSSKGPWSENLSGES